ncbi:MAG: hypothetical protein BWY04_00933 [candidate division CPR1 bacterium ADurb.Bin160]|uniref:Uncharacterized protein n=1 Tax=candidate division CPR1 bacterium ADurb.Bin160 TaxID=1852826 RepID=A0A1V5ZMW4_9BACT|nr:MAG: hypothetical protein BWY04_00933 [candidate division CPR1 bacterium ADurb.Bin160]
MYKSNNLGAILHKLRSKLSAKRFLFSMPSVIQVKINHIINHNVIESNKVIINHIFTSLVLAHSSFFISISS